MLAALEGREVRCGRRGVQPHVLPADDLREQIVVWVIVQRSHLHAEWAISHVLSSIPHELYTGFANDVLSSIPCELYTNFANNVLSSIPCELYTGYANDAC